MLNLTARRVQQMAESGEIEATRTQGGHWRIPIEAIERELQRRREGFSRLLFLESLLSHREDASLPEPFQASPRPLDLEREFGRLQGRLEAITEERDRLLRDLERERERAESLQRELNRLKNQ
jgi:excisionase family DNA binding protein